MAQAEIRREFSGEDKKALGALQFLVAYCAGRKCGKCVCGVHSGGEWKPCKIGMAKDFSQSGS